MPFPPSGRTWSACSVRRRCTDRLLERFRDDLDVGRAGGRDPAEHRPHAVEGHGRRSTDHPGRRGFHLAPGYRGWHRSVPMEDAGLHQGRLDPAGRARLAVLLLVRDARAMDGADLSTAVARLFRLAAAELQTSKRRCPRPSPGSSRRARSSTTRVNCSWMTAFRRSSPLLTARPPVRPRPNWASSRRILLSRPRRRSCGRGSHSAPGGAGDGQCRGARRSRTRIDLKRMPSRSTTASVRIWHMSRRLVAMVHFTGRVIRDQCARGSAGAAGRDEDGRFNWRRLAKKFAAPREPCGQRARSRLLRNLLAAGARSSGSDLLMMNP